MLVAKALESSRCCRGSNIPSRPVCKKRCSQRIVAFAVKEERNCRRRCFRRRRHYRRRCRRQRHRRRRYRRRRKTPVTSGLWLNLWVYFVLETRRAREKELLCLKGPGGEGCKTTAGTMRPQVVHVGDVTTAEVGEGESEGGRWRRGHHGWLEIGERAQQEALPQAREGERE